MIGVLQLARKFDILIDKLESDYLTSEEKVMFLNMGQDALLKEMVYDRILDRRTNGELRLKMEENQHISIYLKSLVEPDVSGVMNDAGKLTYAEIEAAMGGGKRFLYPMALRLSDDGIVFSTARFVRINDLGPTLDNAFKTPKVCAPIYLVYSEWLGIYPKDHEFEYRMDVLRYPARMNIDDAVPANNVDCELDPILEGEILVRAIRFAGISIRDQQLFQAAIVETTQNQV